MSFYTNENGVSPIIATLMLILITIMAASALAVISSQVLEDHTGRVELISAVEGENLRIVDIGLFNNTTSSTGMPHQLNYINITVHNLDIRSVEILSVMINKNHARNFTAKEVSGVFVSGVFNYTFNHTNRLSIPGGGYRILVVNTSDLSPGAITIFNNESIHVEIMTSRVNIFSRVFTPPILLPIVRSESEFVAPGRPINILILDASRSSDPDRDGFIESYVWNVRYANVSNTYEIHISPPLFGQQVRPIFINTTPTPANPLINATNIEISLTITDNTGMISRQENFTNLTGHFNWTA